MAFPKVAALLVFVALPVFAQQSPADLLQKGIYTQETAGDLDGALQIYRQITTASPADRAYSAQAQLKIGQILLRKGDLNGAALEFQTLARTYPDYSRMIGLAARDRGLVKLVGSPPEVGAVTLGTVQNGRYHHNRTGVEIALPHGWSLAGDTQSSGNGEIAMLAGPEPAPEFAAVWMKSPDYPVTDIPSMLRGDINVKISQRTDFQGYTIRPESILPRTVSGQLALSAVADYVEDGKKMVEYLTWVRSPKTHAFFFERMPASDFVVQRSRFDQLIESALVP